LTGCTNSTLLYSTLESIPDPSWTLRNLKTDYLPLTLLPTVATSPEDSQQ
jgi:hypothetical protein